MFKPVIVRIWRRLRVLVRSFSARQMRSGRGTTCSEYSTGYNGTVMTPAARPVDSAEHVFELTGGLLCLDFTNTVGDRPGCRNDHLHGYGDLLSWARQALAIPGEEIEQLALHASRKKGKAEEVFSRAVCLRESLYRIFSRVAVGARPPERDLAVLNSWLAGSLTYLRIEASEDSFVWSWSGSQTTLERVLWPVVRSAADLLTSQDLAQIRECASEVCSWLFVDRSRTHRRRWCDMKTCGNRAKARRYYQRKRKEERELRSRA